MPLTPSRLEKLHVQKYFLNLVESTRNQVVFTIFRLNGIQTDVRLDPIQSGNVKYNLILGLFNKIQKIFLRVCIH